MSKINQIDRPVKMWSNKTNKNNYNTNNYNTNNRWTDADIQPRTVSADSASIVGASYYAGFQLMKKAFENSHANWCCVTSQAERWVIPPA